MNKLKKMRQDRLMSKLELAREAGVSAVTIDRIEKGYKCRVSTKRKILNAFGLSIDEKDLLFEASDEDEDEDGYDD